MRISVKLTAGFLAIAALVGLVGYLTSLANDAIQAHVEHLSRASMVEMVDASDMTIAVLGSHDALHDLIEEKRRASAMHSPNVGSEEEISQSRKAVQTSLVAFQRSFEHTRQARESVLKSAEEQGNQGLAGIERKKLSVRLNRLNDAFVEHRAIVNECLDLVDTNIAKADEILDIKLDRHFDDVLFPLIKSQRDLAEKEFSEEVDGVDRVVGAANVRITSVTLVALSFALVLGLFLSRSIGKPLEQLKTAALQIGKGRLNTRIQTHSRDEIGVLAETFNSMAEDLQATTVSKAYVDNILESMSELLIVADPQLQIQLVNRAALEQLEFTSQELVGKPLAMLFASRRFLAARENDIPQELFGVHEHVLLTKSGRRIPVHWAGSELQYPLGALQGIVCVALNIAERKLVEERLRASLDEKEVLLKEVHHRVKNNLQIISSLLALQARETADPDSCRMFEESQGRIRSMALIHEQLYQSGELSQIDFSEYVRRLCLNLIESSGASDGCVALHIDVVPAPLPLNLAIPCGMILNELVSNALKHAFPANRRGQVDIGFHVAGERHTLSVCDNGLGIRVPSRRHKMGSLGLKIVDALVKQLDGQLQVESVDGASFTISFDCVTNMAAAPKQLPASSAS